MSKDDIQKSIDELRHELSLLDDDQEDVKGRISGLISDIEAQVDAPESESGFSLTQHIEELEVKHPQITAIINQIATTLSNMGI